jgi:hypothetical protein
VFETRPSPYAVQASNWAVQSLSGPLVRKLRSIDPNRNWSIMVTERTATMRAPFLYYTTRGYLIEGKDDNFAVFVYHKADDVILDRGYRPDLFDDFQSVVSLSPHVLRYYGIPQSDLAPMPVPKSPPRP